MTPKILKKSMVIHGKKKYTSLNFFRIFQKKAFFYEDLKIGREVRSYHTLGHFRTRMRILSIGMRIVKMKKKKEIRISSPRSCKFVTHICTIGTTILKEEAENEIAKRCKSRDRVLIPP